MSNCTRLEIDDILNDLDDETSVPSDVIGNFFNNVSSGEELASGDVDKVLTVLDKAIKVSPKFKMPSVLIAKKKRFISCECRSKLIGLRIRKTLKLMQIRLRNKA